MELIFQLQAVLGDGLHRFSDRVNLPPRVLSSILDSYGSSDLPHPLIFKIRHQEKVAFIGVKEFSSSDNLLEMPELIFNELEIAVDNADVVVELVTSIPKGRSLTITPLQFYPQIYNWKYFLESKLTKYYTTLTSGKVLYIEDGEKVYELMIDSVEAMDEVSNVISIIDTDIILDVKPLNDIMAAQQLEFSKASFIGEPDKIKELKPKEVNHLRTDPITSLTFKPELFKLDLNNFVLKTVEICLRYVNTEDQDMSNIDLIASMDYLLSLKNFRYSTMNEDQRMLTVSGLSKRKSIEIDVGENNLKPEPNYLYIAVFSWENLADVELFVSLKEDNREHNELDALNFKKCQNCNKLIDPAKYALHEAYCLRNNIKCKCGQVFLHLIPADHWHCELCPQTVYGNTKLSMQKHNNFYHGSTYKCPQCDNETTFKNYFDLVKNHQALDCPGKLHECRFCHLLVPQGKATATERLLGLTHHESECGNKTTDCYRCGKVIRRKDLETHLRMHELDKIQMNENMVSAFSRCANENCTSLLSEESNELSLCGTCYGPLYVSQSDPNYSKLQARIERRYMLQLSKGCGFAWCHNDKCRTFNKAFEGKPLVQLLSYIKQELFPHIASPLLPVNKPVAAQLPKTNTFWFCVNESIQKRHNIVTQLILEGQYLPEVIYKAVNQVPDASLESTRAWLHEYGVRQAT